MSSLVFVFVKIELKCIQSLNLRYTKTISCLQETLLIINTTTLNVKLALLVYIYMSQQEFSLKNTVKEVLKAKYIYTIYNDKMHVLLFTNAVGTEEAAFPVSKPQWRYTTTSVHPVVTHFPRF